MASDIENVVAGIFRFHKRQRDHAKPRNASEEAYRKAVKKAQHDYYHGIKDDDR